MHFKRVFFCSFFLDDGIWVKKPAECHYKVSYHRDKGQQIEAKDLKPLFIFLHSADTCWKGLENLFKLQANLQLLYYKSSWPTKATLSTLHDSRWKALTTKVESYMAPFCDCLLSFIIKEGRKGSSETIVTTAITPELMLEPFSMRGFLSLTGN